MKTLTRSFFAVLAMGLLMFGCKPDNVDPSGNGGGKIAGAFDNQHATLDTVCKYTAPMRFRSTSGSYEVDKCLGAGGVLIPCTTTQMGWGQAVMYNGYTGVSTGQPQHWLDIDFSLAGGWVCDFTNWAFVISNGITVDPNTGVPSTTGSDWQSLVVNPFRNQWKVAIPVDSLPAGTFDMACRMTILRLKLNGQPNEPTRTTVWLINELWNVTGSEYASNNEFAVRYTPLGCLESQCPTTLTNTVCEAVYTGITCTGNTMNTTTLTADTTGAGANATFLWSNGATTRTITVAPTATTSYTVTISKGACAVRTTTFNVNVIDASCVIGGGNGGGGNGGSGNGGSGSGNGGSGSGPNCGPNHHNGNHNGCSHNNSHPVNCGNGHRLGNHSQCSHSGNRPNCGPNHRYGNHNGCTHGNGNPANCGNNHHNNNHTGCTHTPSGNGGNGGSGSGNGGSGSGNGGSGSGHGGNTGNGGGAPGVKVCHVPPGNPNGATTVCVSIAQLNSHVTGVCGGNGGGGNGGGGSGGSSNGSGSGNGGSGSGNHGSAPNCGNGHHNGNHSGCTHNNSHPANCGNGHSSGNHSQCSHSGGGNSGSNGSGNGSGGHGAHGGGAHGCGHGNPTGGHSGDYIGACNSNPCR